VIINNLNIYGSLEMVYSLVSCTHLFQEETCLQVTEIEHKPKSSDFYISLQF